MKGMDLCQKYYLECIKPIIDDHCQFLNNQYSCGLFGWGSDVQRNDDEFSRDHEWGPRLILLLDCNNNSQIQQLYKILDECIPTEFIGFQTRTTFDNEYGACVPSDTGNINIDIRTYDEYIVEYAGTISPSSDLEWLCIPENKLFELTGGEIFYDYQNRLEDKLAIFKNYYPLDVWKYRLSYLWQIISWNVDIIGLCNARKDYISSKLALYKTIVPVTKLISTYNRRYAPSYCKWIGTELYKLPYLAEVAGQLIKECLITNDTLLIRQNLEKILQDIVDFHNSFDSLPQIEMFRLQEYNRGFWDIDCMKISTIIHKSIQGELSKIPLYGAVDQFVINEDMLLNPAFLKRCETLYGL